MGVRDRIAKAVMGIKAYHSSPHDFDRFDLSKIGTGEGAQMYGHGIYAAENPAVSGQGGQYWQQFKSRFSEPEVLAAEKLQRTGFDRVKAIADQQAEIDDIMTAIGTGKLPRGVAGDYTDPVLIQSIGKSMLRDRQEQLNLLMSNKPVGPRTYELNIKADPATMLDWDKPLREQSGAVQDVYKRIMPEGTTPWGFEPKTGADFHNAAAAQAVYGTTKRKDAAVVADALREAGIPGIKYLDEGSRNARPVMTTTPHGDVISSRVPPPTSNYVIFDPSIIDITKKYGIPGAIAAPVMGAIGNQSQYEEPQ